MAAYVRIVNTASGGTAVQLVHDHRADARTGPKPPIVAGLLAASGAMVWLAQLGARRLRRGMLGPLILTGVGPA